MYYGVGTVAEPRQFTVGNASRVDFLRKPTFRIEGNMFMRLTISGIFKTHHFILWDRRIDVVSEEGVTSGRFDSLS